MPKKRVAKHTAIKTKKVKESIIAGIVIPVKARKRETKPVAVVASNETPKSSQVKTITTSTSKDIEVALVIGNTRVPHQDDKAIQLTLMHSKDLGPSKIFFSGDMIDYFNRSDIDRNPLRIFTQKEIAAMQSGIKKRVRDQESDDQESEDNSAKEEERKPHKVKTLSDLQLARLTKWEIYERAHRKELQILFGVMKLFRDTHPNSELIWIWGCQEYYLEKRLTKYHPVLLGEIDDFCKQNKIQKVFNGTRNNTYNYGALVIGHWFRGGLSSPSGSIAHILMDEEGCSLIQGHTNRGGWACRTLQGPKPDFISGFENFSLCKRPTGKNWQLGYSLVYKEKDHRRFQVFQVPIANYGFFYGLREYRLDLTRVGDWETSITFSDIHFRFEDPVALKVTLDFTEEIQPNNIFVNGDVPDFPDISRFSNSPLDTLTDDDLKDLNSLVLESRRQGKSKKYIKPRLQRDFERIHAFFKDLRRRCPKAKIYWIYGNHDHRMQGHVEDNTPQLAGVRRPGDKGDILSLAEVTKVSEFNVEIVYSGKNESSMIYGDLLIGHFYKVSNKSSATARALINQKHKSLLQPHVHRMGACYKTKNDGTVLVGVEMGCLCRLDPDWMENPNWQHGFVVIHKKKNSKRFYLQPIQIVDGAFLFGGKRYGRGHASESQEVSPSADKKE
ncbi:MAG: metallophosphoesterase [Candidatus Yanofskybacteria bacterium]|nr:metallophosphoesterase [Candidatus Yanofskybacteria bacterium]